MVVKLGDKVDIVWNLLYNTGINHEDREFGINLDDYYRVSFLFAWDRTPDNCKRFHRHKKDSGTIDINIKTKVPLKETVTVIFYATYSSDIIIQDGIVHVQNFKKIMWSSEMENLLELDNNFIGCYPYEKLLIIESKNN